MDLARFSSNTALRIGEAEAAIAAPDLDVWMPLTEALASLYRWESWVTARDGRDAYYPRRAADGDGRVLGALTLFRGAVEHGGIDNSVLGWVDAEVFVVVDGEQHPVEVRHRIDGEWRPTVVRSATLLWPDHTDWKPPTHGREFWYSDLIAGKRIGATLRQAERFLRTQG